MSSLQQMLKERQTAVKEAQKADALKPDGSIIAVADNTIATGAQGSVEGVISVGEPPKPEGILDEERAAKALGVYQDLNLRKFFDSKGTAVRAVDGFFYAENDLDLAQLAHYEKAGKVVKYSKEEAK